MVLDVHAPDGHVPDGLVLYNRASDNHTPGISVRHNADATAGVSAPRAESGGTVISATGWSSLVLGPLRLKTKSVPDPNVNLVVIWGGRMND